LSIPPLASFPGDRAAATSRTNNHTDSINYEPKTTSASDR
jgi:hypothetical protein